MSNFKLHMDSHIYLTDQKNMVLLEDVRISNTLEGQSKDFDLFKAHLLKDVEILKQTIENLIWQEGDGAI